MTLYVDMSTAGPYSTAFSDYLEECGLMNNVLNTLINNYMSDDDMRDFAESEFDIEFIHE